MEWTKITGSRYELEILDSILTLYRDSDDFWTLKLDINGLHIRDVIQGTIEEVKKSAIEIIKERLKYYKNNILEYIEELSC